MAYLKPNAFVKLFNKLAMKFGISGAKTLVTTGRKSGNPHRIPVILAELNGKRYLVSTRGESEWVLNLRANNQGQLEVGGKAESFKATEIPVEERPPIIENYKKAAGKVVDNYFAALPEPADHPTFLIEP